MNKPQSQASQRTGKVVEAGGHETNKQTRLPQGMDVVTAQTRAEAMGTWRDLCPEKQHSSRAGEDNWEHAGGRVGWHVRGQCDPRVSRGQCRPCEHGGGATQKGKGAFGEDCRCPTGNLGFRDFKVCKHGLELALWYSGAGSCLRHHHSMLEHSFESSCSTSNLTPC